jgi:hypothetical protein
VNDDEIRKVVSDVVAREMYACAKKAADQAVTDALQRIGIDVDHPLEAQKRAQTLAKITLWFERGGVTAWSTLIALFVTGAALALWRVVAGD